MQKGLAVFLCLLILLQSFGREVIVLDYTLHKARITELFCVNKDKPQMRCNGKCHLQKRLANTTDAESKDPNGVAGKIKYDALPPVARPASVLLSVADVIAGTHKSAAKIVYAFEGASGIFRPPLQQLI